MQTISFLKFRLQESGLGSQDFLSEKPWNLKKKICWNYFYIRGKRQHILFVCELIIRFKQFGAEKIIINSFSNFFKKLFRIIWNLKKTKKKMRIRNTGSQTYANNKQWTLDIYYILLQTKKLWLLPWTCQRMSVSFISRV